jgi:UDP-N-acetylmuramoylalanine--D-glutamate ligase
MAGDGSGGEVLDHFDHLRPVCVEHLEASMNDLEGKRVMVVGLGVSGRAAARFLAVRGAQLVLTDRRPDAPTAGLPAAEIHLGEGDPAWLAGVSLLVVSPGVPRDSALVVEARRRGVPVIGELELASRFVAGPLVAITGTNGKSTVTTMVGEALKRAGMNVFVGGNLGVPLIEAAGREFDALVVEVSSFQLETIETFHPRVAVHLNLTDDHFERYSGLEEYGRAKARIFENQDPGDFAILNRDDRNVFALAPGLRAQVVSFGCGVPPPIGNAIWPEDGSLAFRVGERRGRIDLSGFRLPGRHNLANAMAASAAALAIGAPPDAIGAALAEFRPLAHRIEFVREWHGVVFIDDSKATNVGAVVEALEAIKPPVILIAGGMDKGGDYTPLRKPLRERVKLAILIGAARDTMRRALDGAVEIAIEPGLAEAVRLAAQVACPGDTVMLSPACSSFDQFRNYAERGEVFKELVRAL